MYDQVARVVLSLCLASRVSIHMQAGLITGKDSRANNSWVIMPIWMFLFETEVPVWEGLTKPYHTVDVELK